MQGVDTRFILVRAECPNVQFELSCSCIQVCSRGYKRAREGARVPSLWFVSVGTCVFVSVLSGCPARGTFPTFIVQVVSVYTEGEERCEGRANPDPYLPSDPYPTWVPLTYLD